MKISSFNFSFIFVLLLLLFILPVSASAESRTYTVGTDNLKVRSSPGSDGAIIGQLNTGNQIVVLKEKYGWAQTYLNGQSAWVATQYLISDNETPKQKSSNTQATVSSVKKSVTITANDVRLRNGPGTAHKVTGSLKYGQTVRLLSTEGDWHRISATDGSTGWVASWLTSTQIAGSSQTPQAQVARKTSTNGSLHGFNIVLDPGHGGNDPGATGFNYVQEKDLTLAMSNAIAGKLRAAGANVIMTRTNDTYVSLAERIQISHSYDTDAFLSIHYNAYPISTVNGFSTHFYTSGRDRQLAQTIQSELAKNVGIHSRGLMQDDYFVLRENRHLAVLLELGFMTNMGDFGQIQSANYEQQVATGITNALIKHFNN